MTNRHVKAVYPAHPTSDGDGVKINRIAISGHLDTFDPFLLLDEIASDDSADYIGGFPPHPHRGFETVTYMLEGAFSHQDHLGNEGLLQAGGVQWMTAGKGVIHSEMPEQKKGALHGFQLWINLPAKDKMQPASYQELEPEQVTEVSIGKQSLARIVAGELAGTVGPVSQVATQPSYFDLRLKADESIAVPTNEGHNTIAFVYDGQVSIGGKIIEKGHLAHLSDGDAVELTTSNQSGGSLLFLSAKPINEPIANYGPFVMNTREEIEQAIADYRNGTLTD